MQLGVHEGSIGLSPLESVAGITVHLVEAIGGSTVREEDHDLVD